VSANNILVLKKTKDGYLLTEQDVDEGKPYYLFVSKDLKKALKKAQELQHRVEYGLWLAI